MDEDKLHFNKQGFLENNAPILMKLPEIERVFVEEFPASETRRVLFENWLNYIFDFQKEIFPFFEQWIDGSFVSKKENPKDIDFVTFIDGRVFELRNKSKMLDRFWSFSLQNEGLDAYLCPIYAENHQNFKQTLVFKERFRTLFGNTKPDFVGQKHPKGFVKIIFEK